MIVVGEKPNRWKVMNSQEHKEGCIIKISNGVNRIAGVYLRPNISELADNMKRKIDLALEWSQPAGILIGDFNARHVTRDIGSNARGNYLHWKLLYSPSKIEIPDGPTFVTTAGRGGLMGAQSLVDIVIQRGFKGKLEAKDTKNDMKADHKAIIYKAARTTTTNTRAGKDRQPVLRRELQRRLEETEIQQMEQIMMSEMTLYDTGGEERGPMDVLQKVIFSNLARDVNGRKRAREMFWM